MTDVTVEYCNSDRVGPRKGRRCAKMEVVGGGCGLVKRVDEVAGAA